MSREKWMCTKKINVRASSETEHCYITGMVLLSDKEMVVIDQNNKSVKYVDIDRETIIGYLKFETIPYSITVIPYQQVCVTFPSVSLVRILSTDGSLAIHRTLNVKENSVATVCNDGKLYVSYKNPCRFEILNKNGTIATVISMDEPCLNLCEIPRYFAIPADGRRIYVADLTRDIILCVDIDGTLINTYEEEDLVEPHDFTIATSGDVYVAYRKSHAVYKFDENLNRGVPILSKIDGLRYPTSLCLASSNKSLFVSSASLEPAVKNVIKKYSIVHTFDIESIDNF